MTDLPDNLDPGIVGVVRWLNAHGFETCDSGDGRSKFAAEEPDPCAMEFPNVAMVVPAEQLAAECDRLLDLLAAEGVALDAISEDPTTDPAVQGTYDPANGIASILLLGVDDERLRTARARKDVHPEPAPNAEEPEKCPEGCPPACPSPALLEARATFRPDVGPIGLVGLGSCDRSGAANCTECPQPTADCPRLTGQPVPPVATSNNLNLLHGAAMRAEAEGIPCVVVRGSLGWDLYCPRDKAGRVVALLKEEAVGDVRFVPYPTAKEAPATGYPDALRVGSPGVKP